jgi:hypothetical protein
MLFDLKNDPSELKNLASEMPNKIDDLLGTLLKWYHESGITP